MLSASLNKTLKSLCSTTGVNIANTSKAFRLAVGRPNTMLRVRRKEGNVLFNDAFNTFHLQLYGVRHMVKDHSDSEKGNTLLPHRLLFPINSKGSFICTIPQAG